MMPRSSSGEFHAVFQALRRGEDAAQRRADVFAEHVGDAEMLLAVVEGETDGLNECGHSPFPPGAGAIIASQFSTAVFDTFP